MPNITTNHAITYTNIYENHWNYRPDHLERVIEQEQDLLYDSNLWANYCPSKNLTNHTKTAF